MREETAREWVVMKFGGTSVSSVECWGTISAQARKHLDGGKSVLVVVSALSGMTNLLTRLAEGMAGEEKSKIRSEILSRHEDLHRMFGMTQDLAQPVQIAEQQPRSLVGGESSGEADGQCLRIEQAGDGTQISR